MAISDPLSRDAVLDVLQQLVRTPSVNPSLAPAEGTGETAIANVARDWFAARGIEAWVEEVAPGRANSIARIGSGPRTNSRFLRSHRYRKHRRHDDSAVRAARRRQSSLRSRKLRHERRRRVADVRSRKTRARKTRGYVMVALVADEEYASIGAQHFVAHHKADACVVTEPSEGRLILAHKGFRVDRSKNRRARCARQPLGFRSERDRKNGTNYFGD